MNFFHEPYMNTKLVYKLFFRLCAQVRSVKSLGSDISKSWKPLDSDSKPQPIVQRMGNMTIDIQCGSHQVVQKKSKLNPLNLALECAQEHFVSIFNYAKSFLVLVI